MRNILIALAITVGTVICNTPVCADVCHSKFASCLLDTKDLTGCNKSIKQCNANCKTNVTPIDDYQTAKVDCLGNCIGEYAKCNLFAVK